MRLRPLYSRILVREEGERLTAAGLVVMGSEEKRQVVRATVVDVGDGYREWDEEIREYRKRPVSVAVGDTVLYQKFAGDKVWVDDEPFTIIDESYILGVCQQDDR